MAKQWESKEDIEIWLKNFEEEELDYPTFMMLLGMVGVGTDMQFSDKIMDSLVTIFNKLSVFQEYDITYNSVDDEITYLTNILELNI